MKIAFLFLALAAALASAGCNSNDPAVQNAERQAFAGVCASVGVIQSGIAAGTIKPNANQQAIVNALQPPCATYFATGQVPSDPATISIDVTEAAIALAPLLQKKHN